MATLEQLQAERAKALAAVQKAGGRGKNPALDQKLAAIEAQVRTTRGPTAPPAADPNVVNPGGKAVNKELGKVPKNIKNVTQGVQADAAVAGVQAGTQEKWNNPDQINPYGTQTTSVDENGNVTVNSQLSADQQKISDQDTQLTQMGNEMANARLKNGGFDQTFDPTQTARKSFGTGDLTADRTRVEDAVYQNLTRRLGRQKSEEWNNQEQSLANRGVAIDPNDPQYSKAQRDINERYDDINAQARDQATIQGSEEYAKMFGIGEQGRANDISQASSIRSQNLGEVSGISGLGTGLQTPNFQPFQAPTVQYTSPTAIDAALTAKQQGAQALQIQQQQANTSAAAQRAAAAKAGRSSNSQPSQPPLF